MSSLSGRFDRGIGLIVNVGLSPAGVFPPPNNAQVQFFPALIDTGATSTCITSSVADKIGLKPIGKRQMASATHRTEVNSYQVRVILPFGDTGIVLPNDLEIMEFNASKDGPFQILLGRDVLCSGILTMSFDGHFTFSI